MQEIVKFVFFAFRLICAKNNRNEVIQTAIHVNYTNFDTPYQPTPSALGL
jgi:hypothetical protein